MSKCTYCNQPADVKEYEVCSNCKSEKIQTTNIKSYYGDLELVSRSDGFFLKLDNHSSSQYKKISLELFNMMLLELVEEK